MCWSPALVLGICEVRLCFWCVFEVKWSSCYASNSCAVFALELVIEFGGSSSWREGRREQVLWLLRCFFILFPLSDWGCSCLLLRYWLEMPLRVSTWTWFDDLLACLHNYELIVCYHCSLMMKALVVWSARCVKCFRIVFLGGFWHWKDASWLLHSSTWANLWQRRLESEQNLEKKEYRLLYFWSHGSC